MMITHHSPSLALDCSNRHVNQARQVHAQLDPHLTSQPHHAVNPPTSCLTFGISSLVLQNVNCTHTLACD